VLASSLTTRIPTLTAGPAPALAGPTLTARTAALSPTVATTTTSIAPALAASGTTGAFPAPLARRPTRTLAGPCPATLAATTAPAASPGPAAARSPGLRRGRCIRRYLGHSRLVGRAGDVGDRVGW
jgi:hypothetical protein